MELKNIAIYLAAYFELSLEQITKKSRKEALVEARQMVTEYLSNYLGDVMIIDGKNRLVTLELIGDLMGFKARDKVGDHSSVKHCMKRVGERSKVEKKYAHRHDNFLKYAKNYNRNINKELELLPEKY